MRSFLISLISLGLRIFLKLVSIFVPVNKKQIIFISFHGRAINDNPNAIYQAMLKDERYANMEFVWACKNPNEVCDKGRIVPYFKMSYFFALMRSQVWVSNCKLQTYIPKKKKQIYIQTWHGTPLKKLAHDIEIAEETSFYRSKISQKKMQKSYDYDVKRYTYMISPNAFCTGVFPSAFLIDPAKLIETGYPRNDILINYTSEDVSRIRQKYHIEEDKKVILYAPTWRDNQYTARGYTFALKCDFKKWKEKLGEEYIVIFKPHYLIAQAFNIEASLLDFVKVVDANIDINELYIISDVLVTDYSSVFFDFGLCLKPMYFYMYDKAYYEKALRGFYLDIEKDVPGNIYEIEDELLAGIKKEDFNYEALEIFNQRFNHLEDGRACERVLQIIWEELNP